MTNSWIKDPDAVLDWAVDWAAWVATGETIESSVIEVQEIDGDAAPLVLDSDSFTDTMVTVWLSGGAINSTYSVGCLIATNQGRIDERTFKIKVKER